MPTTNYYTVNGEIIGEHTTGQSRLDYIPDGMGSLVATIDQTLTVQSTARFKPFGADLATTGTMPSFGWAGNTGSRRTGRLHMDIYNQARHVGTQEGQWTTIDPNWPSEPAFTYCLGNPTTLVDPSGRNPRSTGPQCNCLPSPHITGYPKSGRASKCLQKACSWYCGLIVNPEDDAKSQCDTIGKAFRSNTTLYACTSGDAWEYCGKIFCDPDGSGYNGADANFSNWPQPKCQSEFQRFITDGDGNIGWQFCEVECHMRVCCHDVTNNSEYKSILGDLFSDCLGVRRKK